MVTAIGAADDDSGWDLANLLSTKDVDISAYISAQGYSPFRSASALNLKDRLTLRLASGLQRVLPRAAHWAEDRVIDHAYGRAIDSYQQELDKIYALRADTVAKEADMEAQIQKSLQTMNSHITDMQRHEEVARDMHQTLDNLAEGGSVEDIYALKCDILTIEDQIQAYIRKTRLEDLRMSRLSELQSRTLAAIRTLDELAEEQTAQLEVLKIHRAYRAV